MNIKQLEAIREYTRAIKETLNADTEGCSSIEGALIELDNEVLRELKSLVWIQYQESKA